VRDCSTRLVAYFEALSAAAAGLKEHDRLLLVRGWTATAVGLERYAV
jgi:hypothetical protein